MTKKELTVHIEKLIKFLKLEVENYQEKKEKAFEKDEIVEFWRNTGLISGAEKEIADLKKIYDMLMGK